METRIQKRLRQDAKNRPKQSVLWRGGRGQCPCCQEPLDLWLASALQQADEDPWVVPEDLLVSIYESLLKRIAEKTINGKWTLHTRCSVALVTDHKALQAKMYFVAINGLAGPFCLPHLKDFLRRWERPDGGVDDVKIYIVNTSHDALKKLLTTRLNQPDCDLISDDPPARDLY